MLLLAAVYANSSFKAVRFIYIIIAMHHYMVTRYVDILIRIAMKLRIFIENQNFYENLEPYGSYVVQKFIVL